MFVGNVTNPSDLTVSLYCGQVLMAGRRKGSTQSKHKAEAAKVVQKKGAARGGYTATLHHLAILVSGFGSRVPVDAVPVPNSVGHNSSLNRITWPDDNWRVKKELRLGKLG